MKELIQQSVFQRLFCCIIAEFAPSVTDMSHPDHFTHNAFLLKPLAQFLKSDTSSLSPCLYLQRIFFHCGVKIIV